MVSKARAGKPNLKNEHNGEAIWLASWKAPEWSFTGMIDEVWVFNKGISADTLNDIASKGIEKTMPVSAKDRLTTKWGSLKASSYH